MRHFTFLAFVFLSFQSFSQTMSISGTIQDTVSHTPLKNAVAMAVRIKDSVLLAYTRTDANGHFILPHVPIDTVQVTISHPRFAELSYYILGSATNNVFEFGKISLPPKSQQLGEVIIYADKDPMYYKGDTLVYLADSFKVKPNATVEDLLKKLPGIKVDKQGKITSNGKEVSQVLVDGDEFFGSDPTVATKNLAANGVESVQVYEKKNENAADGEGETTQVMDLKLKEDAKKGYFGKVSGASDINNFHEGELLANKFEGSRKVSVFTLASNTPRSSFGWGDTYKYGLDNEYNYYEGDDDENYFYGNNNQNNGIPKTLKSGFYYTDKLGDKTKFGANYTYNKNELFAVDTTLSQYFLADTNYVTKNNTQNRQNNVVHSINFKLTQTLDSLTEITIEPKIKINNAHQNNYQSTDFISAENQLMRQTNVKNTNDASGYDINTTAKLNRKFKKRDRLFRLNYNFILTKNNAEGLLQSFNTFFNSTVPNDSVDQKKINENHLETHNATAIYTEPLTKKIKLEFEYNFNYNISGQSKKTQNISNGEYTLYDSLFTNDFKSLKVINRLGVKFIKDKKKQSFNFGARIRNVAITNTNVISEKIVNQSINNILPFLGYTYRFSENTRFNFRYTTSSKQPTIDQLQPIPDNNNPNQIKVGNPNLLPTFENKVNTSFNSYKPVSGKYVWISASFSNTDKDFTNSIWYDSIGRTLTQTINVNNNYNTSFNLGGGIPVFSKALYIQPNGSCYYNQRTSLINFQKNITKTLNSNLGLELQYDIDTIVCSFGYNFGYNLPSSTVSVISNEPYFEQSYNASFKMKFPYKFLLETDAQYTKSSKRAQGYNINYVVWNASISKSFLKTENLILTVSGNDILNQNILNTRTVHDNVITDSKTNIISRYFLLKLTYKFNNTKTKDNDDYY